MRTVLFERGAMRGDCLNYGCVPSKALLAAAKGAQSVRTAIRYGITAADIAIDFSAVMSHVRSTIEAIAPKDSVERFERLRVRVIPAQATFSGRRAASGGPPCAPARRLAPSHR